MSILPVICKDAVIITPDAVIAPKVAAVGFMVEVCTNPLIEVRIGIRLLPSRSQDLRSAVEYHQQAYQIAVSLGDLNRQGIALANQGLALEGLTELQAAFQALEQAQEIFLLLNSDYLQKTNQDLERIKTALS